MERRPRLPGTEAIDIMNRHKHRGYDDWKVAEDWSEVYSEKHNTDFNENFSFMIWEARAIAQNYLYFVGMGWIKDEDTISLIDATDALEA